MPTSRREKPKTESLQEHNQTIFDRLDDEDISLYDFVREFWSVIEPGKKFVDGKHIEAICKHLEAVTNGLILRLLVNIAPRHAKSSIISVLWRVWTWIKRPWLRWLCASYALSLSVRDNVKCRRLILSQKFQDRFRHVLKLKRDQNAKIKFENDQLGYSQATSVGSSATGEGGDILLIDDCHSIDEKRSDIGIEKAIEWFRDTWYTRRNDPVESRMVVVGQRVRIDDVSGFILSGETGDEWVHLNLPTEFEPSDRCVTVPLKEGEKPWEDWRKLEGELLWAERFPQEVIERAKRRHGPLAYAALYQQKPVPAGGLIFNKKNQRYFTIDQTTQCYLLETPRGIKPVPFADCWRLCTADLAISEKQTADYTVFAAYAITPYKDLLLLDLVRDRFPFDEQLDQLVLFHEKHGFSLAAIESVAYQLAMVQSAIKRGLPAQPYHPPSDKVTRSTTASIWDANGKSYNHKNAVWLFDYEKEKFNFPKAPHNDQVDTHSLAAIVVCTQQRPGVLDGSKKKDIDDTLSIEQLLDAAEIAREQAAQAAKDKQEEKNPARGINPFEWAAAGHEGGWDW
jgi:predicted phage terminase large subunit-like protein